MDLDDGLRSVADDVAVDTAGAWARHTTRVAAWRRRRLVTGVGAAAAAMVVAVIGVMALTGDDEPDQVRSRPEVPPAIENDATTTTVVATPAGPFPATAVVSLEDGRLVVLDTSTGDVLRNLVTYNSIDDPPLDDGAPRPNYVTDIALAEAGSIAYVSACCEPASGDTRTYSTADGAELRIRMDAESLSVSPNGSTIAVGPWLYLPSEPYVGPGDQQPDGQVYGTTWIDGDTIGYLVSSFDGVSDGVWLIDLGEGRLLNPRPLVPMLAIQFPFPHLTTRRDGMLIWVSAAGIAHVVDPASGEEQSTFDLGGPVLDIAYDASRTWLLTCTEDRRLVWHGGGESGTIPGRCIAAGW